MKKPILLTGEDGSKIVFWAPNGFIAGKDDRYVLTTIHIFGAEQALRVKEKAEQIYKKLEEK